MSQLVRIDSENLSRILECPIGLTPLREAVSLFPCAHKINSEIAAEIFGPLQNNNACNPRPCPVCRTVVVGYSPDFAIRAIVEKLFPNNNETIAIPHEFYIPDETKEIRYPGERGEFFPLPRHLCKFHAEAGCRSKNKNALIHEVWLNYNPQQGPSFKISINFNARDKKREFFDYLIYKGMPVNQFDRAHGIYRTSNNKEFKDLFHILNENNDLPDEFRYRALDIIRTL